MCSHSANVGNRPIPQPPQSRSPRNSPHIRNPPALYRTFQNGPSNACVRIFGNRVFGVVRVCLLLTAMSPGPLAPAFASIPRKSPFSKEPFSANRHLLRHRSSVGVASHQPAERSSQRSPSLPSSGRRSCLVGSGIAWDVIRPTIFLSGWAGSAVPQSLLAIQAGSRNLLGVPPFPKSGHYGSPIKFRSRVGLPAGRLPIRGHPKSGCPRIGNMADIVSQSHAIRPASMPARALRIRAPGARGAQRRAEIVAPVGSAGNTLGILADRNAPRAGRSVGRSEGGGGLSFRHQRPSPGLLRQKPGLIRELVTTH